MLPPYFISCCYFSSVCLVTSAFKNVKYLNPHSFPCSDSCADVIIAFPDKSLRADSTCCCIHLVASGNTEWLLRQGKVFVLFYKEILLFQKGSLEELEVSNGYKDGSVSLYPSKRGPHSLRRICTNGRIFRWGGIAPRLRTAAFEMGK